MCLPFTMNDAKGITQNTSTLTIMSYSSLIRDDIPWYLAQITNVTGKRRTKRFIHSFIPLKRNRSITEDHLSRSNSASSSSPHVTDDEPSRLADGHRDPPLRCCRKSVALSQDLETKHDTDDLCTGIAYGWMCLLLTARNARYGRQRFWHNRTKTRWRRSPSILATLSHG